MSLTPYGLYCQNLRNKYDVSQKTLAKILSKNPSYLSALEHGRKGKPEDEMINKIIDHFSLSELEAQDLRNAASDSDPNLRLPPNILAKTYRVARLFVERADSLNEGDLNVLEAVLINKRLEGRATSMKK